MFGKTKSDGGGHDRPDDTWDPDALANAILGDEVAATRAATMEEAVTRLGAIERQLHSQFTSMAAYAQIAHEQVELARSEARAENEQLERRLLGLVERERADRVAAAEHLTGSDPASLAQRLDAVERLVTELHAGLAACLAQQKSLADAITRHLSQRSGQQLHAPHSGQPLPAPHHGQPLPAPRPGARPPTTAADAAATPPGSVDDAAPIAALRLD